MQASHATHSQKTYRAYIKGVQNECINISYQWINFRSFPLHQCEHEQLQLIASFFSSVKKIGTINLENTHFNDLLNNNSFIAFWCIQNRNVCVDHLNLARNQLGTLDKTRWDALLVFLNSFKQVSRISFYANQLSGEQVASLRIALSIKNPSIMLYLKSEFSSNNSEDEHQQCVTSHRPLDTSASIAEKMIIAIERCAAASHQELDWSNLPLHHLKEKDLLTVEAALQAHNYRSLSTNSPPLHVIKKLNLSNHALKNLGAEQKITLCFPAFQMIDLSNNHLGEAHATFLHSLFEQITNNAQHLLSINLSSTRFNSLLSDPRLITSILHQLSSKRIPLASLNLENNQLGWNYNFSYFFNNFVFFLETFKKIELLQLSDNNFCLKEIDFLYRLKNIETYLIQHIESKEHRIVHSDPDRLIYPTREAEHQWIQYCLEKRKKNKPLTLVQPTKHSTHKWQRDTPLKVAFLKDNSWSCKDTKQSFQRQRLHYGTFFDSEKLELRSEKCFPKQRIRRMY